MEPNQLDQVHDLGFGAPQQDAAPPAPQTVGEHRQVDHQRGVGKVQIAQIYDHIRLSAECEHQSPPAKALGTPILIPGTEQHRRVVGELKDLRKLHENTAETQVQPSGSVRVGLR